MIDKNKRYKILMAEQDRFLLDMYKRKFEETGLDFIPMSEITENFIERVVKEKPHIISLGVVIPTIDGFTAIRMLKKDKRTKNIPIIFLTNLGEKKDIELGLSLGAIEYLVMAQTTPTDLVNTVIKHLNKIYNANIASIKTVVEKIQTKSNEKEENLVHKKRHYEKHLIKLMNNELQKNKWFAILLALAIVIYLGILGYREYQKKVNNQTEILKFCTTEIMKKNNLWQRYNDLDAHNRCLESFGL